MKNLGDLNTTMMYIPRLRCVFFYTWTLNCGNSKGPKYKSVMVWSFSTAQVELLLWTTFHDCVVCEKLDFTLCGSRGRILIYFPPPPNTLLWLRAAPAIFYVCYLENISSCSLQGSPQQIDLLCFFLSPKVRPLEVAFLVWPGQESNSGGGVSLSGPLTFDL